MSAEIESTELVQGEVSVDIISYETQPAPAEAEPTFAEPEAEYAPPPDIIAHAEGLAPLPETEALILYFPGTVAPETEAEEPPTGPAGRAYDLERRSQAA